jgi:hypothetical protein
MQFMIIPENKNARISNLFPHGNQQPASSTQHLSINHRDFVPSQITLNNL